MDLSKLIKSVSGTSYQPEVARVKNTKDHNVRHNEKVWAIGEIIEVSMKEAEGLHKDGFKVIEDDEKEIEIIVPTADDKAGEK